MKYDFKIRDIPKNVAVDFVQSTHYSKVMPRLTKHFLGCFLGNKLTGVLTLGWGTQPKGTINKLFNGFDTNDYYEIGKMCMLEEMPRNSESQMVSSVVLWIKKYHPEKKFLFTWADGIMGKAGYVYQASNFLYGGFIWTQIYISKDGEKIHPRSSKALCDENVEFLLEKNPNFFDNRKAKKIYWLTQDFLDHKNIKKIHGKQFRYIFPLNKKSRKLLNKSNVEWSLQYPKERDLLWDVSTKNGKKRLNGKPKIDGGVVDVNKNNVNSGKTGQMELFI
mgnify:CR=1 FL=1